MSVKERLIKFAKSKERSVRAFEIRCGLTIGYINAIRVSIHPDKIRSIASCYPDLNTGWLLTGEGEMLKESPKSGLPQGKPHNVVNSDVNVIMYFPEIDASATPTEMFDPGNRNVHKDIIVPGFDDCEYALNVWGDSMFPVLNSGEIVLVKEWKESFVEFGLIYLIVTKMNHRMIKFLQPGSSEETLSCVSANEFYKPVEIKKADIIKLYLVKGHISRKVI